MCRGGMGRWYDRRVRGRADDKSLTDAVAVLKAHRFVDLTHTFAPGIPHWKGAPNER